MKNIFLLLLVSLLCHALTAQTWTWESAPVNGKTAIVRVSDVDAKGPFNLVAYSFKDSKLMAEDVKMLPGSEKGVFRGSFETPAQANFVYVSLRNEDGESVTGVEYMIQNPTAPKGAGAIEKALASTRYAGFLQIDAAKEGLEGFYNATSIAPEWLNSSDVVQTYYSVAKRQKSNRDIDVVRNWTKDVQKNPKNYNEDALVQGFYLTRDLGDTIAATALRKKIDKQYPKSILKQDDDFKSFQKLTAVADQIKQLEKIEKTYPESLQNRNMRDQMVGTIIQNYAEKEDWKNAFSYLQQVRNPMTRANIANEIGWTMSGESLDGQAKDLDYAEKISALSLSSLDDSEVPPGYTKREWTNVLENYKSMYGDTYALILFKKGDVEKALKYQEAAVRQNKGSEAEMNERYIAYLEKAKQYKQLEQFIEESIATGKSTPYMQEVHAKYWLEKKTKEELYDRYLAMLNDKALAMRMDELNKKWVDEASHDFTLTDLSGKQVKLSDYKGKVVVLDFWATWCGPCKASFPGMKMAVEHFASDADVVFLFMNSWEQGEGAKERVASFISDNKYPFHVVLDSENKAIESYGVNGIPTKYIIGPDQKIHFVSRGYGGSTEGLFEELKLMVEMVKTADARS